MSANELAPIGSATPPPRIRSAEADPFRLGLANLFGLGGAGYWFLGQRRKAVQTWILVVLGTFCTCGTVYVFAFVTAYDVYLLGQRLEFGESIGTEQNALPVLRAIFR